MASIVTGTLWLGNKCSWLERACGSIGWSRSARGVLKEACSLLFSVHQELVPVGIIKKNQDKWLSQKANEVSDFVKLEC